jgi:HD domain.
LGKNFESRLSGVNDLAKVLSADEQEIWCLTQQVLNRTKTIHWSRAREIKKPVDQGAIFRTAHYLAQRFSYGLLGLTPERIHNIYSLVENIRNAHYSLISDPDMFSMILTTLEELGWQGEIIIESPALLQLVRERRRPFIDEINALGEWIPRARKNILERIFKENGIFGNDLEDVLNFSFSEAVASLSPEFFGVLRKVFPLLIEVYPLELKRKVNEGLYLRHILRTMVLADEFYHQLKEKGEIDNLDYETLMIAAALHDAIEISRENGREVSVEYLQERLKGIGFNEDDARNISHMSEFLAPKKTSSENYFEQKQKDFDRIWDGKGLDEEEKPWWEYNKDYLKVIKAADVFANLEETVDDLEKGRKDGRMKRSLVERYQVFEYRIGQINQWLKGDLFEKQRKKNEELINYLLDQIPRFKRFRELNLPLGIEIKYVVGEDKLVIAPPDFYVHNIMVRHISGSCSGGVIRVQAVNDVPVIYFVRGASSIKTDNNGENFFKWLSLGQDGKIEVLEPNPNNPVAGLTEE